MNLRGAAVLETRWPDTIVDRNGASDQVLLRVDDPLVERIWKGDSVLGWEGEDRLRLYACPHTQTFELLRYCEDHVLRTIHRLSAETTPLADVPGKIILFLVQHDRNRGFDLLAHLDAEEAKFAKAKDDADTEQWGEALPRAQHAWQKLAGVAESHLPFSIGLSA